MSSYWLDDKRAIKLVFFLVELGIVNWEDRHRLLSYWEKIHGS